MRPLAAILSDLEAAHAMMARALAELVLAQQQPRQVLGRVYDFNGEKLTLNQLAQRAGCSDAAMHFRLRRYTPAEAVAMGPPSLHRSKVKAPGSGNPPKRYDFGGEKLTVLELAARAGCGEQAMYKRLRKMPAEQAVALGKAPPRSRRVPAEPKPPKAVAPPPPPPPPAPRPSVFEVRAPKPAPMVQSSPRVTVPTATQQRLDVATLNPKAEAIEPPDVKRTVYEPAERPPVPSTFGRIGEYGETSRWAETVAGGRA